MTNTLEVFWEGDPTGAGVAKGRYVEELTPREHEVLIKLALGNTLHDAAVYLGISRNTVHTHVKNIYQKLGVNSRSQAMLAAMRLRLFKP